MQFDPPLAEGTLVRRYKRFLADVVTSDGALLTLHCPNTGAMHRCNEPDSPVWFSKSDNPKRKYPHTLEAVHTSQGIAGVNTGRANALVAEALRAGTITELAGYAQLQREAAVPQIVSTKSAGGHTGRFDFKLSEPLTPQQTAAGPCYVEVKSVTYALGDGLGVFPDAVSTRALRHLQALVACRQQGMRAVLLFCVQHTGVERVAAAADIYPEYAHALTVAVAAGVEVLAYRAVLGIEEFRLQQPLPVLL